MNKKRLVILIDFDNFFNKIHLTNINATKFEIDLKNIIYSLLEEQNNIDIQYVLIRLYSGWYKENTLTNHASIVLTKLAEINLFPIFWNNQIIKGKIEIATSLIVNREYILYNTYQEKEGLPRLRIKKDLLTDNCHKNKYRCPILLLNNFTKKKNKICYVNNCSYQHKEIFFSKVQKMVDTMIACDIIEFSERKEVVYLISDDVDHIPALIQGSKKNNNIFIGIKNEYKLEYYKITLNNFGIKTILL